MKTIIRGDKEEAALWWHSQCLDKNGRMWRYGRAWLHWPGNCIGVCWSLFRSNFSVRLAFSDTGDHAIEIGLSLPFLFSLWLHIERSKWIKRLPGVKWTGKWGSGDREVYIRFHDSALRWTLWRFTGESKSGDWRDSNFNITDFFLGKPKYSETERLSFDTFIEMPEGVYSAKAELYTATWKRPRWPLSESVARANVEIEGGIPVPGDGDNDWDIGDDAIYSMNCCASTVEEVKIAVTSSAMRDRQLNGGEAWVPDAGWPAHCNIVKP